MKDRIEYKDYEILFNQHKDLKQKADKLAAALNTIIEDQIPGVLMNWPKWRKYMAVATKALKEMKELK